MSGIFDTKIWSMDTSLGTLIQSHVSGGRVRPHMSHIPQNATESTTPHKLKTKTGNFKEGNNKNNVRKMEFYENVCLASNSIAIKYVIKLHFSLWTCNVLTKFSRKSICFDRILNSPDVNVRHLHMDKWPRCLVQSLGLPPTPTTQPPTHWLNDRMDFLLLWLSFVSSLHCRKAAH